jgi:quinoprotein dehydrogenase-associated probable ABC transporter substrate-binding protein
VHGRITLGVALICAIVFSASRADAQAVEIIDHHALRVCADPSAPPFSTEDGSGFENRIAALFAADLGVPVRYTWFPNTMGFYRRTLNVRQCDLVMGAPAEMEMAQPTTPYYRSTFVLAWRSADHWALKGLADPALKTRQIGAQARTPPGTLLVRYGLADNLHAYDLMVDSRVSSVGGQMVTDLLAHRIDVAVLWGPVAAYQAGLHPGELSLLSLGESQDGVQMAFDIAMAVRKGEPVWRARVDRFITTHRQDIAAILASAHVPVVSPPEATP